MKLKFTIVDSSFLKFTFFDIFSFTVLRIKPKASSMPQACLKHALPRSYTSAPENYLYIVKQYWHPFSLKWQAQLVDLGGKNVCQGLSALQRKLKLPAEVTVQVLLRGHLQNFSTQPRLFVAQIRRYALKRWNKINFYCFLRDLLKWNWPLFFWHAVLRSTVFALFCKGSQHK